MENTMLIQITNPKAVKLLHELEELQLIKVLDEDNSNIKAKLSDKYKGVFSKEDAESFDEHTRIMRKEWSNT